MCKFFPTSKSIYQFLLSAIFLVKVMLKSYARHDQVKNKSPLTLLQILRTSVLPGHIDSCHFWQVCPIEEFQKVVLISFEHIKKLSNFPKLQGYGKKNEPATPISYLNLNSSQIN